MPGLSHHRLWLALAAFLAGARPARADGPVTLESSTLRLEVTAEPYRYRLVEKSTSEVLVSESATTFLLAPPPAPAPDGGLFDAAPDAPVPDASPSDASPSDATPSDAAPADGPGSDSPAADGGAGLPPADAAPPPPLVVPVVRASTLAVSSDAIDATLVLAGGSATAHVRFSFPTPEVLEVRLSLDDPATAGISEEFDDQQEHYYGVWEYPFGGNLDNRGVEADYLGLQQNPGINYSSARAPFYVTSRRYGVYARSEAHGHYRLGVGGKSGFAFDGPSLTYDVIYGPGYYDVLARYTALAGGPAMPPLWALGSTWWSDDFHFDLHGAANAQANVIDLATQLQAHQIPAGGLLIDRPYGTGVNGWGNMDFDATFPDPPQMVSDLHARGLELALWIANRAWNGLYTDGSARGFLFPVSPLLGPAADLRNPAAYAWMRGKLDPLAALGVKGYKIDRGEEGEQPDAVQNQNVTLFARAAREGLVARQGDDVFLFTRNVVDTGRQQTAVWNGDSESTFTGLAYSVTSGLRSGAIAMPMWGSDTGGYQRPAGNPTEELFARWLGFAAFSPFMEVLVGESHTPWYDYSPALVQIARQHAATHHDLIPYTRSFLHAATTSGAPVLRPLVFSYPDDASLANRSDEYLYGSELLVAPVLTAGATTRDVYLPAGRWLDYGGRRAVFAGAQTVSAVAPLDTLPVFVREGGIVPRGPVLRGNDDWTAGWAPALRIELFPSDQDLSRSFDYFTGAGAVTITAATAGHRLTVTFDDPGLGGTLAIQVAAAGKVERNGVVLTRDRDYQLDPTARLLTIPFSGTTMVTVDDLGSVFAPTPPTAPPGHGCSCALERGERPAPLLWLVLALAVGARQARRRRLAEVRLGRPPEGVGDHTVPGGPQ